ncbi:hypothetical protein AVEN_145129-1 [Araneus ventricosus]|uniref:Uncharacterized protein n=1 Tax=Araneus ventricosus TaxID=182803 RepID=A0A4Y2GQM0_ARAVE|nr:hypothetical protein AVEN_145129-1 [Araneus ventricosus]
MFCFGIEKPSHKAVFLFGESFLRGLCCPLISCATPTLSLRRSLRCFFSLFSPTQADEELGLASNRLFGAFLEKVSRSDGRNPQSGCFTWFLVYTQKP